MYRELIEKLSYLKMGVENEVPLAQRRKVSSHSNGEDIGKVSK